MKNLLLTLSLLPAFAFASGAAAPQSQSQEAAAPNPTNTSCLAYSNAAIEKLAKIDSRLLLDDDQLMFTKSLDDLRAGVEKAKAETNDENSDGQVVSSTTNAVYDCSGESPIALARSQAKMACLEKFSACKELNTSMVESNGCYNVAKSMFTGKYPRK